RSTAPVTPNPNYLLRYWFLTLDMQNRNTSVLRFYFNGVLQGPDDVLTAPPNCEWRPAVHGWNSGAATTLDIQMTDIISAANGNDFGLDDIELVAVPCALSVAVTPGPLQVCDGLPKVLWAVGHGSGPISYQWRRNGVNLADEPGRYQGSTTELLRLVLMRDADQGVYDCVVQNWCGNPATSAPIQVAMIPQGCRYQESGDAGDTPATAQAAYAREFVAGIEGTIGANDADMYSIMICSPEEFSATTCNNSTHFDTQLFLFTETGAAVAANDDNPGGAGVCSRLTNTCLQGPGLYYLAISMYNKDPYTPFPGPMLLF